MKLLLGVAAAVIVGGTGVFASEGFGTSGTLRAAIDDLIATHGDRYPGGASFLQRLDALGPEPSENDLAALRREALLAHPGLAGNRLLVLERDARARVLPQNWQGNEALPRGPVANRLAILHDLRGQPRLETLLEPEDQKLIADVDLHPDADRLMFSMIGEHNRWQIHEMRLDGSAPRTLPLIIEPDVDNYDSVYLPNGDILFSSTATYTGVPCVNGSSQVANLHRFEPGSGAIQRLTFDQEHNWNPTVLPDGRVMYLRWEYSDLPHSNSRILFQMNPDGTNQAELYGSNSYFPNSFFYARPIPGHPSQVIGVVGGHHGVARAGRLMIVDPDVDRREAEGVIHEFPHRGREVEAIVKDQLVKDVWPQFLMPWPLDGKYVLVSCKPGPKSAWGIYLVDAFDNLTLIHEVPGKSLMEPVLLAKQPQAPLIPDRTDPGETQASVLLTDIYRGPGLEGVPRGAVKSLRIVEYYFSMRGMGGMLGGIGMDGPWDIRRVLGTVPVEEDGSAHFTIPAQRPVFVQPLDEKGQAMQTMRSWFTGMPGERISCIGCHEGMNQAPPSAPAMAATRSPSAIKASWQAPLRGFSFDREVQPVLDRHCAGCHAGEEGHAEPYLKGDRKISDWSSQIAGNAGGRGGRFTASYAELHRYIRRPGIESDMRILSPMDYHFSTTELGRMLEQGHHGVDLDAESFDRIVTWADINAPFHGTWGEIVGENNVRPKLDRANELRRGRAAPVPDYEAIPELPPYDTTSVVNEAPPVEPRGVTLEVGAPGGGERRLDLGGGVGLDLVKVPGGRFNGEPVAPFWIGTTEVTNEQFRRFRSGHDSRDESRHGYQFGRRGYDMNQPGQPVVRVAWNDAEAFARWIAGQHGLAAGLPTGLQWEWACRAGATTDFPFGGIDADYSAHANLGDRKLKEFAACTAKAAYHRAEPILNPNHYDDWIPRDDRFDDGHLVAAKVASYQPNAWGLHDMIGNAWEWTAEVTGDGRRVARGGSWYDRPQRATVRDRVIYQPYQRVFNVGFRIVVSELPPTAKR
ncbi:SUMF1/EgtB/PvdO family nonheme iron enzyme [Haloferula sp. A504]|uniref:HzsA-related protein n=1 Tax=Haloferula sp. A504 TaxID=3373601 RepID=UPI0031BF41F3|nr:SUMF1/EgtB/PvdO family nonheme iron enzyme [Verrucomicrobiaceae bacterium E54]